MPQNEVLGWVFGGTAGAGLLAWLIRHLVVTVFSTKSEVARIAAGDAFAERLYAEIHRLEEIIAKQNTRIDEMERKLDQLRQSELADLADLAEINIIIETSCMGKPDSACGANKKLKVILDRIRDRRLK